MTQVPLTRLPVNDSADVPETAAVAESEAGEFEPTHLLHFEPLAAQGPALDIPCDPLGRVGLDGLGDKARNDYFFARALIGCLFAKPTVKAAMPLLQA